MSIHKQIALLSNKVCCKVLNHLNTPFIDCVKYIFFGSENKYIELVSDINYFADYLSLPKKLYQKNFGSEFEIYSANILDSDRVEEKTRALLIENKYTYILRFRYINKNGVHYVEFWSKRELHLAKNFLLNNLTYYKNIGKELVKLAQLEVKNKDLLHFNGEKVSANIDALIQLLETTTFAEREMKPNNNPLLPFNTSESGLTTQELKVIGLFYHGMLGTEIAQYLSLSPRTIENHFMNIKSKLNCHSTSHIIPILLQRSTL